MEYSELLDRASENQDPYQRMVRIHNNNIFWSKLNMINIISNYNIHKSTEIFTTRNSIYHVSSYMH